MSFDDWMKKVDAAVSAKVGLGASDLADIAYWDLWSDGVSAKSAARIALENEGWMD
jgi:hypothetical protein